MIDLRPGDVMWAGKGVCILVPGLERKSVKLGRTLLVARSEDLDTEEVAEPIELPTEVTKCL